MTTDWNPLLRDQFEQPYWSELMSFVDAERNRYPVYPPRDEVFAALHYTSFKEARVVILGQDPYHGAGQAHGLCFSVRRGVPKPPSVANIHRELHDDLGLDPPDHGNLEAWAANGVLLLNTTLTVRAGEAGSHRGRGWERFTDRVIEVVSGRDTPVVFVLWGSAAREKRSMISRATSSPLPAWTLSYHSLPVGSDSRCAAPALRSGKKPMLSEWSATTRKSSGMASRTRPAVVDSISSPRANR